MSDDSDVLLCDAAEAGDAANVRSLVAAGSSVNAGRPDGSSALLLAALGGHSEACSELVNLGANVQHAKENGATAIFAAAAAGAVKCVDVLYAAGASPNAPNTHGVTPLQMAAHKNHAETVGMLLRIGGDPSALDNAGNSALHKAARSNAADAVEALLAHLGSAKSDTTKLHESLLMRNKLGLTPIEMGLQAGSADCATRLMLAERSITEKMLLRDEELVAAQEAVERGSQAQEEAGRKLDQEVASQKAELKVLAEELDCVRATEKDERLEKEKAVARALAESEAHREALRESELALVAARYESEEAATEIGRLRQELEAAGKRLDFCLGRKKEEDEEMTKRHEAEIGALRGSLGGGRWTSQDGKRN